MDRNRPPCRRIRSFGAVAGAVLSLVLLAAAGQELLAMNKADLVTEIASGAGISKADAKRALEGFISATEGALKKGDKISLVGFGSFSISNRAARTGRNPQTGAEIKIAAKRVVRFKAGADLSGAVKAAELPGAVECDIDISTGEQTADDIARAMEADGVAQAPALLDLILRLMTKALLTEGDVRIVGFGEFQRGADGGVRFAPGGALSLSPSAEAQQTVTRHVALSATTYMQVLATMHAAEDPATGALVNQLLVPDDRRLVRAVDRYLREIGKEIRRGHTRIAPGERLLRPRARLVDEALDRLTALAGGPIAPWDVTTVWQRTLDETGGAVIRLPDDVSEYLIDMMVLQGQMIDEWDAAFRLTSELDPLGPLCEVPAAPDGH